MSKIPPQAKKVFSGVVFDVYQWEQELFDGTVATFEMIKRPSTVVVIPVNGDRVFYAHQEQPGKPPFVSLFGGRAEEGETPQQTAERELLEETGFKSSNWELLREDNPSSKIDWTIYTFIARDCERVAAPKLDGGEKIDILSASVDEFVSKIAVLPLFSEVEIKNEILSLYNPEAAERLKQRLRGLPL